MQSHATHTLRSNASDSLGPPSRCCAGCDLQPLPPRARQPAIHANPLPDVPRARHVALNLGCVHVVSRRRGRVLLLRSRWQRVDAGVCGVGAGWGTGDYWIPGEEGEGGAAGWWVGRGDAPVEWIETRNRNPPARPLLPRPKSGRRRRCPPLNTQHTPTHNTPTTTNQNQPRNNPKPKRSKQNQLDFGSRPIERQLVLSAQFLQRELPVRLAHRVAELENLPYGLSSKPQVLKVRYFGVVFGCCWLELVVVVVVLLGVAVVWGAAGLGLRVATH